MNNNINTNVYLNGGVDGRSKQQDNFEQNLTKHQAIAKLKDCNYRTPSKEIAFYLETIFGLWEVKPLHWFNTAKFYTPKTINSVISQMTKAYKRSGVPFETPGAYFTSVIKHKQKRKIFRATNGTQKQQMS